MEAQVKLPRELEEEILSRLPPQSLVRFRSVCRRWNALLDEKCFINSHMSHSRPHLICMTDSKLCSINIIGLDSDHPTPELRELPFSDFPDMNINSGKIFITAFDEFLFCTSWSEDRPAVLWNPWLKQFELIKHNDIIFFPYGLGYNNTLPEKFYKIFGCYMIRCDEVGHMYISRAAIYECRSQAFKFIDTTKEWPLWEVNQPLVPFNGNLYWVARNGKTDCFIQSFDFSEEILKPFCTCPNNDQSGDQLGLAVFKGDRFSLLKHDRSNLIRIWVMETKKIDSGNGEVVWINLMTLSNNLPTYYDNKMCAISYFIYVKTLIMFCGDYQSTSACVYISRGDVMKKYDLSHYGFRYGCHCVYAPNFTPLPLRLQVE